MKRIIGISLAVLAAVCLFRFAQLINTAHAQNGNGRGHVEHRINPDGADNNSDDQGNAPETNPRAARASAPTTGSTTTQTPAITFHGGPVIGTPTAYVIWYGNWNQSNGSDTPAGQQIVRDFLSSIGGSPYFRINTTYTGVSGGVTRGAEYTDTGSQGTRLTDSRVFSVVNNAINGGHLPYDANGIYFVLTSSNISESSGFCSQYCGWHTAGNGTVGHIRYSFVGNANRCLSSCAAQTTGPNGNAGVDGMISVIAHELEEATTDPDLNAWYDSNGSEDADKCAWTFGHSQYQTANGAFANMHLGTRDFLIQRELAATDSKCYINWDTKAQ
jgi:Phosphate-induced protein 1 conserved region